MKKQESIPDDKKELANSIVQYTELRIEQFDLLARSAEEDTEQYFAEVSELGQRIERLNIYQQGSALEAINNTVQTQ